MPIIAYLLPFFCWSCRKPFGWCITAGNQLGTQENTPKACEHQDDHLKWPYNPQQEYSHELFLLFRRCFSHWSHCGRNYYCQCVRRIATNLGFIVCKPTLGPPTRRLLSRTCMPLFIIKSEYLSSYHHHHRLISFRIKCIQCHCRLVHRRSIRQWRIRRHADVL